MNKCLLGLLSFRLIKVCVQHPPEGTMRCMRGSGEECFFENGTSFDTFKQQTSYGIFYP
jgi:hypothetical protein